MNMGSGEFEEIGHYGGQVIFRVVTGEDGQRAYQITGQGSRGGPMALFAIYALPQGVAIGQIKLGGIGQPWNPPPIPGCFPVFITSDSQGKFGHQCPKCRGYWRGGDSVCPYCGIRAQRHEFLTDAQRLYVAQYCALLRHALHQEKDGEYTIDMDTVADAVGKDAEKPPFYYAEESQQNKFTCDACGGFNDILGKFGYCSACGTRNDLQELKGKIIPSIRSRTNSGGPYEACLKDSASAFDSFVAQYVKQLTQNIPMRPSRKARIERMRFLDLNSVSTELKSVFDIDICDGLKDTEVACASLMFHRRHVYEHNGGEADEKYIADSGDKLVRLKQALSESQQSVHEFTNLVAKMACNLHRGFHEIFPPEQEPISFYAQTERRMKAHREN
jgi:hypothetical protein